VPIFAERTVAWAVDASGGQEAHNSAGVSEGGSAWVIAGGESGGVDNADTVVSIAALSAVSDQVRVRLQFDDGTTSEKTFEVAPTGSLRVSMGTGFPEASDRSYSITVESLGDRQLVVEGTIYRGANRAAGSSASGTRVR